MARRSTVLLLMLLTAYAPQAAAQQPRALGEQRYLRGLALYDARQYSESLDELRASYELRPSPNSRLYIARALRELGRIAEAASEFETTVLEARELAATDARYRATADAAQRELAPLEPRVGRLVIALAASPRGTRVFLDEVAFPASVSGLPLVVSPGNHTLRVEAPGAPPYARDVVVEAGATARVDLSPPVSQGPAALTPPPARGGAVGPWLRHGRGPLRAVTFVTAAVGVASWVSFGVAGAMGLANWDALRVRCGAGPCPASERAAVQAGRTQQTIANVSLAIGLTAAVGTVVLLIVGPRVESSAPAATSLTFDASGLSLRGNF